MKISEAIKVLTEIMAEHGDLPIALVDVETLTDYFELHSGVISVMTVAPDCVFHPQASLPQGEKFVGI